MKFNFEIKSFKIYPGPAEPPGCPPPAAPGADPGADLLN